MLPSLQLALAMHNHIAVWMCLPNLGLSKLFTSLACSNHYKAISLRRHSNHWNIWIQQMSTFSILRASGNMRFHRHYEQENLGHSLKKLETYKLNNLYVHEVILSTTSVLMQRQSLGIHSRNWNMWTQKNVVLHTFMLRASGNPCVLHTRWKPKSCAPSQGIETFDLNNCLCFTHLYFKSLWKSLHFYTHDGSTSPWLPFKELKHLNSTNVYVLHTFMLRATGNPCILHTWWKYKSWVSTQEMKMWTHEKCVFYTHSCKSPWKSLRLTHMMETQILCIPSRNSTLNSTNVYVLHRFMLRASGNWWVLHTWWNTNPRHPLK